MIIGNFFDVLMEEPPACFRHVSVVLRLSEGTKDGVLPMRRRRSSFVAFDINSKLFVFKWQSEGEQRCIDYRKFVCFSFRKFEQIFEVFIFWIVEVKSSPQPGS